MEDRLRPGFQRERGRCLRDPVGDSRNAEHSRPAAMRFWYFHCPHRRREVAPRGHPVGSPGGISPPGSHRSRRDSLPSPGSSHPVIQAMVVQLQCTNRLGSRCTTPFHHAMALLNDRSRLYFLRAHRRM